MEPVPKIAIIGGGAAGFFAAINLAGTNGRVRVKLFEKSSQFLSKVRISGGGRCNVTHACFEPGLLIDYYPRGGKQLLGCFHRFGPSDTIHWFEERGVRLKTEYDGRMFPVTDSSQTIIDLFLQEAGRSGVELNINSGVTEIRPGNKGWELSFTTGQKEIFDKVLIATGSAPSVWKMLETMGLKTVSPVPSLFTFRIKDKNIAGLMGISIPDAEISIPDLRLRSRGPVLFTHWGLSGPAVLKLSAFGAVKLHERNYVFEVVINFLPGLTEEKVTSILKKERTESSKKQIGTISPFTILPKRFWQYLLNEVAINNESTWADISNKSIQQLTERLRSFKNRVEGKSTFKDEFVTCGGVSLDEVDLRTMEAKRFPGLYLAGEALNVDGITGGFNFQHAWTSGWLAAVGITEKLKT